MRTRRLRSNSLTNGISSMKKKDSVHTQPPLNVNGMTERQQLAFLLRTTAPEENNDEFQKVTFAANERERDLIQMERSSGEMTYELNCIGKKRARRSEETKAHIKSTSANLQHGTNVGIEKITNQCQEHMLVAGLGLRDISSHHDAHKTGHHLFCDESRAQQLPENDSNSFGEERNKPKTSPTSTNDGTHLLSFDQLRNDGRFQTSSKEYPDTSNGFWGMNCCALCCPHTHEGPVAPLEVLFLCAQCDKKYPTQRALGRI
uniref:AlNc14C51G4012 protein n=1 Tax=Albugo laibachii Nc14 TaxID=890382 RepID=F0WBG5_9STRA|nr:AlNc14C51G4012 [Albugo laibachii Nc14]|eukprot:CCA18491.1 AlNc14C51G4012 [Albugo laibachii Nc14]